MAGYKLLLGLTVLSFAVAQSADADPETGIGRAQPLNIDTGRYIVRFSEAGSRRFRKRDGSFDTGSFFNVLEDSTSEVTPVTTFNSELFHGASFDLRNGSADIVTELEALPDVESIWPAAVFTIPEMAQNRDVPDFPTWNPHNDTNVAWAHADGHRGDGVVVAVVDSGIDYSHPALGGGFGEGFKVEKGYDFVGDDYEPGMEYSPDDDPMDCNGHGTHVAGIVSSTNEIVPGVAPGARLRAYKVFGCGTSTYEDVIIAAFLRAHEEGADIITASLGSDRGFPDGPLAVVASAIQAAGTFVSIAAGNSGGVGPFYTSSGGNVLDGTTVGSVQHDELAGYMTVATSASGETREIVYISESQIQWEFNGTMPAAFAPEANPCRFSGVPTVRKAILVHPRGSCSWQLHDSGIASRVDYVFYYNFEGSSYEIPDRVVYNLDLQAKGFGLISYEDGKWLENQYEEGHDIEFEFLNDNHPLGVGLESYAVGRINSFSSWGPTIDARMKPDISAPGGSIFSTWPVGSGSWSVQSGTSMATPYIAGVAALFFSSQGGREVIGPQAAAIARRKIIASGKPVYHHDGTDNLASVAQQGAGLVDAQKVIGSTTFITPAILNLNDTVHFSARQIIEITNEGEASATYQITHDAGITTHSRPQANAWIAQSPPYSSGEGNTAVVEFSETEVTLQAGESVTITATFTEPSNLDPEMLPVYGGGIVVASSRGDVLRVPYMGIKGSLYAADTWEMERGVPLMMNSGGGLVQDGQNFTFEDDIVPMGYFNVLFSTREISFEFVSRDWEESDWAYPVVPGRNKIAGHLRTIPQGLSQSVTNFPVKGWARNSGGFYARPQNVFANGEDIPAGEYRLLGRTLRTFGDPNNLDDWQWKLSPWFRVTREKPAPEPEPSTTTQPSPSSSVPTAEPTRPCNETNRLLDVKARVGSDTELRGFYRSSDMLAIDLTGSQTHFTFELEEDGHIFVADGPTSNLYLSVHSNSNSLVYMYGPGRITGAWSYLDCSVVCGNRLKCVSNDKTSLYVCDNGTGYLRSGPQVVEGCEKLHLFVEELQCEAAPALPTVAP